MEDLAAIASPNRFFEEDEEEDCDFINHNDDDDNDHYYSNHHPPMNLVSEVMRRGECLPLLAGSLEKISLFPPLSDGNFRSDNLISTPAAASDLEASSDNSLLDAPVSKVEGDFRSFKMQFLLDGAHVSYYISLASSADNKSYGSIRRRNGGTRLRRSRPSRG